MPVLTTNSSRTSNKPASSSGRTPRSYDRASKLQSAPARPQVDPLVEVLGSLIERMHSNGGMTYREMSELSWVSPSTLAKYRHRRGRYIRSDTLRGILRIFGLKLKVE